MHAITEAPKKLKFFFDDNSLIHSFLLYLYILFFTKPPQILFGSFGNPLLSSDGASILLAIHVSFMAKIRIYMFFTEILHDLCN